MIKGLYDKIVKKEELRPTLIALKKELREGKNKAKLQLRYYTLGNYNALMKCLAEDDPKVRKNAAEILGIIGCEDALDVLMDAYQLEEQLFVKAEYVKAMAALDCKEYLYIFKERLAELKAMIPEPSTTKHIQEESYALQELILKKEGLKKHRFNGWNTENEMILVTQNAFRQVMAESIEEKTTIIGGGVKVKTDEMKKILNLRTYKEILFPLEGCQKLARDTKVITEALLKSNLSQILAKNHEGDDIYYYRLGVVGYQSLEERSAFVKKMVLAIEDEFASKLINSSSHYEIELRMIENREGLVNIYLKLYTLPDLRFAYRKETVSTGMQPYLAAGLMALAKPYLKEHAQILDPFCGAGTLLLERCYAKPVRNAYGIDIFGEAIEKARKNTNCAGIHINYINRDFSDFTHDYDFDEILADMPVFSIEDKDKEARMYQVLFEQGEKLLAEDGRIILYSSEIHEVKKQLRLHPSYKLLVQLDILEKIGKKLFIIGR